MHFIAMLGLVFASLFPVFVFGLLALAVPIVGVMTVPDRADRYSEFAPRHPTSVR